MTRINTNVSSLIAQKTLQRSNQQLQQSLTRLSTGLRINVGKDDPAGLIASEALRSDINSVEKAITNSERANQLISTADSALGQVSALLNDIRGLVSEAANVGALSGDQVAANQLQLDSSLEAIDRIAQITSFQGKRLLDGSLDFIIDSVDTKIRDLQIDQANFGTLNQIGVDINVVSQATRAQLNYSFGAIADATVLEVAGANGSEAFQFAAGSTIDEIATAVNLVSDATGVEAVVEQEATAGSINLSSFGADNDIVLTANDTGFDAGNVRVKYSTSATPGGALDVTYVAASGDDPATLDIQLETQAYVAASASFNDTGDNDNGFSITAAVGGTEFNDIDITFVATGTLGDFTYDHDAKTLEIEVGAATDTATNLVTALQANTDFTALFTAALDANQDGAGTVAVANLNTLAESTAGGIDGGAILSTANDVIAAINADGDAGAVLTASLAAGNDGHEVVTAFQEFAYYGAAEANNRLQFLAPEGTRNVRFVSNAGQALGVDLTTDPQAETFSTATLQAENANASLVFEARQAGADLDGVAIRFNDSTDNTVVYDPEGKELTFNVDITGGVTAGDIITLLNNDTYASNFFRASNFGNSDGTGDIEAADDNTAVTSGGVSSPGTLIVNLATNASGVVTTTANDLIAFFDDADNAATLQGLGISIANVGGSDGTGLLAATTSDLAFATGGTLLEADNSEVTIDAVNGEDARITFTAVVAGAEFDGVQIIFEDTATAGSETVTYDAQAKTLTFAIEEGTTDAEDIADLLNGDATASQFFTALEVGDGSGTLTTFDGGVTSGGLVDNGDEDGAGLLGNSDQASIGLTFRSSNFGSEQFVSVKALSGTFDVTNVGGSTTTRSNGTDVVARINGIEAVGNGRQASINTSSLDLSFTVDSLAQDGDKFSFNITGGGALFQLGPDVVSNQQARLGIQSVGTATLGGVSGRLFELRSGGAKALEVDAGGAAKVVDEVISTVTQLRGRLGAFQRTTLETNIFTLNDTLANLTDAESSIRDADFAAESARLTRAQILVQSGTSVLSIANSNPQNVLALLR